MYKYLTRMSFLECSASTFSLMKDSYKKMLLSTLLLSWDKLLSHEIKKYQCSDFKKKFTKIVYQSINLKQ